MPRAHREASQFGVRTRDALLTVLLAALLGPGCVAPVALQDELAPFRECHGQLVDGRDAPCIQEATWVDPQPEVPASYVAGTGRSSVAAELSFRWTLNGLGGMRWGVEYTVHDGQFADQGFGFGGVVVAPGQQALAWQATVAHGFVPAPDPWVGLQKDAFVLLYKARTNAADSEWQNATFVPLWGVDDDPIPLTLTMVVTAPDGHYYLHNGRAPELGYSLALPGKAVFHVHQHMFGDVTLGP